MPARSTERRALAAAALLLLLSAPPARSGDIQQPGEIQQPKGNWQVPGEIQQPKGNWQVPGQIQVPRGIQAIDSSRSGCQRRFAVLGDALFAFDKATLDPGAEETLSVLGPQLVAAGPHPAKVVGHTDSIGSDSYNQRLSERRAAAVRDWLVAHHDLPAGTPASGRGRLEPVAPNRKPDGSDDPAGRQKNRRVEVLVDSCS